MNPPDDAYRPAFEKLTARCRALTERYARARMDDGERHSTIAFEFGYLFKDAREALPADPESPWGIEAFETAYEEIRFACFSEPTAGDTDAS
ncbi:MAG: hypothetical protein ABIL58_18085 [Pseudomonadota bacterium]